MWKEPQTIFGNAYLKRSFYSSGFTGVSPSCVADMPAESALWEEQQNIFGGAYLGGSFYSSGFTGGSSPAAWQACLLKAHCVARATGYFGERLFRVFLLFVGLHWGLPQLRGRHAC